MKKNVVGYGGIFLPRGVLRKFSKAAERSIRRRTGVDARVTSIVVNYDILAPADQQRGRRSNKKRG